MCFCLIVESNAVNVYCRWQLFWEDLKIKINKVSFVVNFRKHKVFQHNKERKRLKYFTHGLWKLLRLCTPDITKIVRRIPNPQYFTVSAFRLYDKSSFDRVTRSAVMGLVRLPTGERVSYIRQSFRNRSEAYTPSYPMHLGSCFSRIKRPWREAYHLFQYIVGEQVVSCPRSPVYCVRNVMAHCDAREGKWRGNWRMEWVASTLTRPRNVVYPTLLKLMRTPRLPAVDWTDSPADLNGLVRLGERRNLVSAHVPSGSARALWLYGGVPIKHLLIILQLKAKNNNKWLITQMI